MSFGSSEWVWVCMCQCEIGSQWFKWNYGASQQLFWFYFFWRERCQHSTDVNRRAKERYESGSERKYKPAKWRCYARYDLCALCENWKRSLGIQSAYFHIVWSRRWVFFAWIYAFCQFVDANDKHSRVKNFLFCSRINEYLVPDSEACKILLLRRSYLISTNAHTKSEKSLNSKMVRHSNKFECFFFLLLLSFRFISHIICYNSMWIARYVFSLFGCWLSSSSSFLWLCMCRDAI